MNQQSKKLIEFFERANKRFLKNHAILLERQLSERTICGALMIELHEVLKSTQYAGYYIDVEFNRNVKAETLIQDKTMSDAYGQIMKINTDLIIHGRGEPPEREDNLIVLEMKKSTRLKKEKDSDRYRLKCLTKPLYSIEEREDGQNSSCGLEVDGKNVPNNLGDYKLGIYYEINFKTKKILIEYYQNGKYLEDRDKIIKYTEEQP